MSPCMCSIRGCFALHAQTSRLIRWWCYINVCFCARLGPSRVLKEERLRSSEDILVMLRLIRLCPLSRCRIPNSFNGRFGCAQVNSDVGQLPNTSELWTAAQRGGGGLSCPSRTVINSRFGLELRMGWQTRAALVDQMDLNNCHWATRTVNFRNIYFSK